MTAAKTTGTKETEISARGPSLTLCRSASRADIARAASGHQAPDIVVYERWTNSNPSTEANESPKQTV